jgi:hypothetical protein
MKQLYLAAWRSLVLFKIHNIVNITFTEVILYRKHGNIRPLNFQALPESLLGATKRKFSLHELLVLVNPKSHLKLRNSPPQDDPGPWFPTKDIRQQPETKAHLSTATRRFHRRSVYRSNEIVTWYGNLIL